MKILEHPTLTNEQVETLSTFADEVYQDTVNVAGWNTITPTLLDYGLSEDLISGNSFKNADFFNLFNGEGDANAVLARQGSTLVLSFRGTDSFRDRLDWVRTSDHFKLFSPLFDALNNYILENPISSLLVTGHSLGAAMVEHYLDTYGGDFISGVSFASPRASLDDSDSRLLNIGHENDIGYSISGLREDNANSTTNIYTAIGEEHGSGLAKEHSRTEYIYTTDRIFQSAYYDQMTRDSLVIIDRTDNAEQIFDTIPNFSNPNAFILGEDDDDDVIQSGRGNDVLEGLGGDDSLIGDNSALFFGDDTLDGGSGNDTLDGGLGNDLFIGGTGNDSIDGGSVSFELLEGADTSVYNGALSEYSLEFLADDSVRITDTIGSRDGSDILTGVSFAQFSDQTVYLSSGQETQIVTDNGDNSNDLPQETSDLTVDLPSGQETQIVTDNGDNSNDLLQEINVTTSSLNTATASSWQPLAKSNVSPDNLLLGDLNGDGTDDVFTSSGGNFKVSYGGTSNWQALAKSNVSPDNLLLGDLNGDGTDDVFTSSGGNFKVSYGGTSNWQALAKSNVSPDNLLLGDINGDGMDDVFTSSGGNFKVSFNTVI